jgi:hypothetical protein
MNKQFKSSIKWKILNRCKSYNNKIIIKNKIQSSQIIQIIITIIIITVLIITVLIILLTTVSLTPA